MILTLQETTSASLCWEWNTVGKIFLQVVHECGVVHRDIKPDNLMVAEDETLKIVDLGVAAMFERGNDRVKTTAGSPAFMAPVCCYLLTF